MLISEACDELAFRDFRFTEMCEARVHLPEIQKYCRDQLFGISGHWLLQTSEKYTNDTTWST